MNSILWVLPVIVVILLGIGFSLSFYLTHRFDLGQVHTPAEYGLQYEDITFPATDGLTLCGVFIPSPSSTRAVIILHGHGGSMDYDIGRAPLFHEAGFNVLLFDFRAHGRSEGQVASFGYLERQDVVGAVNFLRSRGIQRIGLLGTSYGGMAAMLAAPICRDIHAVLSDGGPARLRTAIKGRTGDWHLPGWVGAFFAWLAVVITSLRLGVNLFQFEPLRWVGKITPRPILFIHGEQDQYLTDFDELYQAAQEPKEAWRVPGVGHTRVYDAYPEEFRRRVLAFFESNLNQA